MKIFYGRFIIMKKTWTKIHRRLLVYLILNHMSGLVWKLYILLNIVGKLVSDFAEADFLINVFLHENIALCAENSYFVKGCLSTEQTHSHLSGVHLEGFAKMAFLELNPSRSDLWQREKINLNVYLHTSL